MIRSIKIKCPLCGEESELFLSMNPTVIVLNCPECWTPLMYTQNEIRVLSEHELNTITAPSTETVLENFFDKITHKKHMTNHQAAYENGMPANQNYGYAAPQATTGNVITTDDVLNLHMELSQCDDVLQFIEKL